MFFATPADLIEALVPYFRAGIAQNEYCIWSVSHPLTKAIANQVLQTSFTASERRKIELAHGIDWYLRNQRIDSEAILKFWRTRADEVLSLGFAGVRGATISLWPRPDIWRDFHEHERTLDRLVRGDRLIVLCAFPIEMSYAQDVVDAAHCHQCLVVRKDHQWEFLEAPGNAAASRELERLNRDIANIKERKALADRLTEREQVILGQIMQGISSKQIARLLNISPRTVDFYRARMLSKLGARNTAELVKLALAAE